MDKLLSFQSSSWSIINWILKSKDQLCSKVVLFVPWFERCWTTEPKFRIVWNLLRENLFSTFQFDFPWLGISDWDYFNTSIDSCLQDLNSAILELRKNIIDLKLYIIAHSYWGCIISTLLERFEKVVLISPALNQKELNKYWFVKQYMKKNNPIVEVTWSNYNILLNESWCFLLNKYEEFVNLPIRSTKYNYISNEHLLSVWMNDYSDSFLWYENKILHIQWDKDEVVPIESLNINFPNYFKVQNWDHDIDSKEIAMSWSKPVVEFFKK